MSIIEELKVFYLILKKVEIFIKDSILGRDIFELIFFIIFRFVCNYFFYYVGNIFFI